MARDIASHPQHGNIVRPVASFFSPLKTEKPFLSTRELTLQHRQLIPEKKH